MPYDPDLPMPQDEFRRFLEEMTLLKRMPKLAEVCECGSLLRLGSRCRGDRNNRQPHLAACPWISQAQAAGHW